MIRLDHFYIKHQSDKKTRQTGDAKNYYSTHSTVWHKLVIYVQIKTSSTGNKEPATARPSWVGGGWREDEMRRLVTVSAHVTFSALTLTVVRQEWHFHSYSSRTEAEGAERELADLYSAETTAASKHYARQKRKPTRSVAVTLSADWIGQPVLSMHPDHLPRDHKSLSSSSSSSSTDS